MNYKNLIGMYRAAINKCIEIICFDDGERNVDGMHEELSKILDVCLYIIPAASCCDERVANVIGLDDAQRLVLLKFNRVLYELANVDKIVSGCNFEQTLGE